MYSIDLCGPWQLSGPDASGKIINIDATVPGCVHTDLQKSGLLGDFFCRDNALSCQWIERGNYTYRRVFDVPHLLKGACLVFEGLDTYCTVTLNGVDIASCDDMHITHIFPVDGILKQGSNILGVAFRSPVCETEKLPSRNAAFTSERLYTRRIQCTYGWDWVDRFVTMGIFRPCRLEFRGENEIDSYYLYTADINPYGAQLHLSVSLRNFVPNGSVLSMEIFNPDGEQIFQKQRVILESCLEEYIDIPSACLWYPNGYGDQPLYTLILRTPQNERSFRFGIRRVTILQPEDAPNDANDLLAHKLKQNPHLRDADMNTRFSGFTLLCNGVKIFCKGANWVPCSPFPSDESDEKIEHLLTLGKQAGVNMLRVWGGGVFEKDCFYNLCDRLGILVTQDFLMACGSYPEEEDWFITALQNEARDAALRLRNHCSLVWWSGDNENAVDGSENRNDFPGYRSAALGIRPILQRFDPQRRFLPSSPYGGDHYCSATRGTTHNTFFLGDLFDYIRNSDFADWPQYMERFLCRFNAEQPVLGMPFASSLQKFLTEEDIYGTDTSMLEFHTKNNPGVGDLSLYQLLDIMTRKLFGEYTDGHNRLLKMQLLQCEWTRITLELFRRKKWYASGIVYWMFNDCWPAANSWSLIDYYGIPKPAYYVFARCAKPVITALSEEEGQILVHICNDSTEKCLGTGRLYLYDFFQKKDLFSHSFVFSVSANTSDCTFRLDTSEYHALRGPDTILLCDIVTNLGNDRAFHLVSRYRDLNLFYILPQAQQNKDGSITLTSPCFLPFALYDAKEAQCSRNAMTMLPGEQVTIQLSNSHVKL